MSSQEAPTSPQLITSQHLEHLALFPLPGAVFFPGTMLPLHIFEARYRAMTAEAIRDGIPIGVVKLREPRELDAQGRSIFHEIGGAGFVLHHQSLPDGRSNILLTGAARVRIIEEIESERPYRVGRAEVVDDQMDLTGSVQALMMTLSSCAVALQTDYDRLSEAITRAIARIPEPGKLANHIAALIVADPEARQRLLEQVRIDARLDTVITHLTELLAEQDGGEEPWLN